MSKRSKKERKARKMNASYGQWSPQSAPQQSTHQSNVLLATNGEPRIKYQSKIYKMLEADGFVGYKEEPGEVLPERRPMNHWTGAKIPWPVLDQIKAYFEWSQATTQSEVTMRLFHNLSTGEWKAWAFPQERGGGMSAKEIGDHPDYKTQRNAIGLGFECVGSIHHHCKASAFQSSTDLADERDWAGVHFTLGHIGESRYDVHVRCVIGDVQSPIELNELFELDEQALAIVPIPMRDELIKYWVCQPPPPNTEFPDVWKSNLVIRPVVSTTHHGTSFPHHHHSTGKGFSSTNFTGPTWDLTDLDGVVLDEDKFNEAFQEWCDSCNMDWIEAIVWLNKLNYTDVPITWYGGSRYTPPPVPMKSKAAQNIEVPVKDDDKTYGESPTIAGHLHHDSAFNDMMGNDDECDEAVWERVIMADAIKNSKRGTDK